MSKDNVFSVDKNGDLVVFDIAQMIAHTTGAFDGFNTGTESNPYDPETNPIEHQAYKLGYDYGVALYCQTID